MCDRPMSTHFLYINLINGVSVVEGDWAVVPMHCCWRAISFTWVLLYFCSFWLYIPHSSIDLSLDAIHCLCVNTIGTDFLYQTDNKLIYRDFE